MAVDVSKCQTVEIVKLSDRVSELNDILSSNTNDGSRDLTIIFDITEVQIVSDELVKLTNETEKPILPNDLTTTNNIVNTLIRLGVHVYVHTYVHMYVYILVYHTVIIHCSLFVCYYYMYLHNYYLFN